MSLWKSGGETAESLLSRAFKGGAKAEAASGAKATGRAAAEAASEVNESLASKYRRQKAEGTLDEVVVDVDSLSEAEAAKIVSKVEEAAGESAPSGGSAKAKLKAFFDNARSRLKGAGETATARWNALTPRQRMGLAAGVAGVAAVGSVGAAYYLDALEGDASAASDSAANQNKPVHLSAAERLIKQIAADKEQIAAIYEDLVVDESLMDDGEKDSVSGGSLSDFDRIESQVSSVAADLRQLRARCGIDATGFELLRRLLIVDPDYLVRAIAMNQKG